MMYIAESLARLGSPDAVPSLWVAYQNVKKGAAPAEYQQPMRDALVVLVGEQAVKDWESEENG